MGLSIYAAQAIANRMFSKTSNLDTPPTLHVALFTTLPSADGSGAVEPSGNGYARVQTAGSDWTVATNAAPSLVENSSKITFPSSTGSWGTVIGFGLYDAASGGNLWAFGSLDQNRTISSGQTPEFAAGDFNYEQKVS